LKKILLIVFTSLAIFQMQGQTRTIPADGGERIVKFYPNPATSFITFDLQKAIDKGCDIQVFNLLGKMVYEQKNIPSHTTISLNDYTRGVYIYQLRDHDGKILDSGKFQVSK
jgi:Secretion system C-terminal sorting domain